jgi:hypothetical protein
MTEHQPEPPWYRKWFLRSLLVIGVGLVALLCAPLMPPIQEFDPDFPTGLDDRERMALFGTIAICAGIVIALICAVVWLRTSAQSAARRYRR